MQFHSLKREKISKELDAVYVSQNTEEYFKIECIKEQKEYHFRGTASLNLFDMRLIKPKTLRVLQLIYSMRG